MSIPAVPFYFLRHGETDYNIDWRVTGQTDVPLNEKGRVQAVEAGRRFPKISRVFTSPLTRAHETARLLKLEAPIHVHEGLSESNFGALEGTVYCKTTLEAWTAGRIVVEGAETAKNFDARVAKAMAEVLQNSGPILVVAHGGVWAALLRLVHLPLTTHLDNCKTVAFVPTKTGWRTKSWEDRKDI